MSITLIIVACFVIHLALRQVVGKAFRRMMDLAGVVAVSLLLLGLYLWKTSGAAERRKYLAEHAVAYDERDFPTDDTEAKQDKRLGDARYYSGPRRDYYSGKDERPEVSIADFIRDSLAFGRRTSMDKLTADEGRQSAYSEQRPDFTVGAAARGPAGYEEKQPGYTIRSAWEYDTSPGFRFSDTMKDALIYGEYEDEEGTPTNKPPANEIPADKNHPLD